MATAGTIAINLIARTEAFTKGMNRSKRSLRGLEKATAKTFRTIRNFSILAAGAAVAGMTALTKSSLASIDAIAKVSDRLSVSTEFLSAFGHAATIAGASQETFTKGLQYMLKNIGEANMGLKSYQDAFTEIGLDYAELARISPEESFLKIAKRLRDVESAATRTSVAMRIFGRSGSQLINMMQGDLDGVIDRANELGITFSRDMAARVEAANDAITRMKSAFVGVGNTLAIAVSPYITAITDRVTDMLSENKGVPAIGRYIESAAISATYLADAFTLVKFSIEAARGAIVKLASVATGVFAKIGELTAKFPGTSDEQRRQIQDSVERIRGIQGELADYAAESFSNSSMLLDKIGDSRRELEKFFENMGKEAAEPAKRAAEAAMEAVEKNGRQKTGSAETFKSQFVRLSGFQSGSMGNTLISINSVLTEMLSIQTKASV